LETGKNWLKYWFRGRGAFFWLGMMVPCLSLPACGEETTTVADEQNWLRSYMADRYLWAGSAPNPPPTGFASVEDYLPALLFPGDATFPADRWSSIGDTTRVSSLYDEGNDVGFGLFVKGYTQGTGIIIDDRFERQLPFKVRYAEPMGPAGLAGLKRGDTIVSVNGKSAADIIATDDYTAIGPVDAGTTLEVVIDNGEGPVLYDLVAKSFPIARVFAATLLTTNAGTKVGYIYFRLFLMQGEAPIREALDSLRGQGATELIVDLRSNGGGFVSTSALVASFIAGQAHNGELFAALKYNDRHSNENVDYRLPAAQAQGFSRALVLTSERTCSASEQLINGLKPLMNVVTLGGPTCGKPVGFTGARFGSHTYDIVDSETFNSLGQGRYWNGLSPDCRIADDFSGVLGSAAEPLTAAALSYLDSGICPGN
jgi:carboxyl-terminal processing protease